MGIRIKSEVYQQWIESGSARRLLSLEAGWLREALADFHGHHLLYAGIDNTPRFLKRTRLRHCFRMAPGWARDSGCDARMQDDAWPLADESVDVVVLQHGLDLSARPHQMMREAARVLVPSGYVVVVGFSPMSVFGLLRRGFTLSSRLPWVVNCVSAPRLSDWLTLLDFRVESVTPVAHLWPLRLLSEGASRRFDRVLAGHSWVPANAYIMVARKTVAGVTPIQPRRWLMNPGFGMAVPAARVAGDTLPTINNQLPTD
ncbi:class I SAM-dependent methyltransferase [Oceanobacter sp. 1_MG-2023]|nr:methyltransferase domain-containing protein [Oceanobacter sp. 1_MG-2023]MDP2608755.1 methyltransferase domain-containing protein [Oceanobacter sp. 1_MG-2023]MDP2611851.1 methyltransferase domain-containing protein [Oceanobacter sp. 2_MG-2023]